MVHAKVKGNIGELAVAKVLAEQGYAVFTELGDLSRTDLIALKDGKCIRLQVKYRTAKDNVVLVSGKKSGPSYSFKYQENDCDVFAVYCPDVNDIAFIPISWVSGGRQVSLRLQQTANGQSYSVRWFKNHRSLEKALRDSTCSAETEDVGDERVQTYNLPIKTARSPKPYKRPTKIKWPSDQELLKLVSEHSMVQVGKKLGVSDNAVRKRLKSRGLVKGSGN